VAEGVKSTDFDPLPLRGDINLRNWFFLNWEISSQIFFVYKLLNKVEIIVRFWTYDNENLDLKVYNS
jgi:hypothetical protein